jgi:hypothetical protein
MADFLLHRLAFGGFALTPNTPEGDAWLEEREADFVPGDACMKGLPDTALGFEPYRIEELAEALNRGEISVERAE